MKKSKTAGEPRENASGETGNKHICDACKILLVDHRKELIEYFTKHKEEILINEILLNDRARETLNLLKKVGEYDIYLP